ncbi:putative bifunctional diguanylate cyclase/phosphodiesterase [Congregibacter litoralis]|uniref:PAS domain protein S-box/diguanylate cyclase (GGDEF) domain protein n=1 Tax=Congregibacter litoralis KT71 TaxID=314285 RepID=A4A7P9_9GAMM|nr:EAL domain-containing protein [Congregibacter litoralis]EAQ97694.1 PAS domain protein S-box/diguanylate cyclase (GGDEF) domain protein [Congregibacter litoralis KT71]
MDAGDAHYNALTSALYWVLVILWLAILSLYVNHLLRAQRSDKAVSVLLVILALDAFRSLIESTYFGFFFNSLYGFLPAGIHDQLSQPHLVIIPKLLNVAVALVILALLIRYWIPRELKQRAQQTADLESARQDADIKRRRAEQESLKRQSILNAISDGIVISDNEGRIAAVNDGMQRVFGYDIEFLRGKETLLLHNSEEEFPPITPLLDGEGPTAPKRAYEACYRRGDGSLFTGETIRSLVRDPDGNVTGFVTVIRDISQRKLNERRLTMAAQVFTHAREGILITDDAGKIIEVNEAFEDITGFSRDEAMGKNPSFLSSGQHSAEFYAAMWDELKKNDYWSGEFFNRRKDGSLFVELITISAIRDANEAVQQYVGLFTDITRMKEHQKQLEHAAKFDSLTDLPNRILLGDRLSMALSQSQRRGSKVAIAYIDLDKFKAINDRLGHAAGDLFLVQLSRQMKTALRETDTLARIGGDEFVALIGDVADKTECAVLLRRLSEAIKTPVTINGEALSVSASIGVTLYPEDSCDADQLLRHADQAMYAAKQNSSHDLEFFDVSEGYNLDLRRALLSEVRQALLRQEFRLFYQPKVHLPSGELLGAEALIRWEHPERGLLKPAEFLPDVETSPLSVEIGDWVIAEALSQMNEWLETGLRVPVSVNVGAMQLQAPDFTEKLTLALARHEALDPSCLELEILETRALADLEATSRIMKACRRLGVRMALDDFGTGYSSLRYLKFLPAEVLKIDQSFVKGMLSDRDDKTIVMAIIGLGETFDREVIAEGVETAEHARELLRLGCGRAQGYAIAHPIPASDFAAWVDGWNNGGAALFTALKQGN